MKARQLEIPDKLWKDKRLPQETKYIYSYIYCKGFDVGEIQQVVKIRNEGLRKSLQLLEELNYLIFKEYQNGMYTVKLN